MHPDFQELITKRYNAMLDEFDLGAMGGEEQEEKKDNHTEGPTDADLEGRDGMSEDYFGSDFVDGDNPDEE